MKANILIVDDSKTIRFQVRGALETAEGCQFTVTEAENGEQALRVLCACNASGLPDVIVLDRNMPSMTGDECIQVLNVDEQWRNIPVLFLTAQSDTQEIVKGLSDLRADDYLPKPFAPQELIARVKVLVRIKQTEDQNRNLNRELQGSLNQQKKAYEELKQTKLQLVETEAIAVMTKVFEKFVPKQFLSFLNKASIMDVKLGDQVERVMTILFADIRGFTTLSEQMTTAENFSFINSYLGRMEPVISEHHGFIDKYIGDAIMALFPTNADDALRGAISMFEALAIYNQDRGKSGYAPIKIGIGLNTGTLMLGTVGGQTRMDGTVISDAVNLASRIEDMNKPYGTSLLISEATWNELKEPFHYNLRLVGRVRARGRNVPFCVFEVLDVEPPSIKEKKMALIKSFEEGLALYHLQEFMEAKKLFEECLIHCPEDKVSTLYLQRCEHYLKLGSSPEWTEDVLFR
ncbi:response regulator [Deltaproteobacteria bacterium TL4]